MAGVVESIRAQRDLLLADVARLDRVLAELGHETGNGRRGGRKVRDITAGIPGRRRKGGRGGSRGVRAPKAGTVGGKILAALGKGPMGNSDIAEAIKLPAKKKTQLSVTLNNLKKRGFVTSPARGTWRATAAANG